MQQAGHRRALLLRSRDEAEGSEAAPVVRLTPTWLLDRARVRTLDPGCPSAEALAIRGGRIVAIGTSAAVGRKVGSRAERLDLDGAVVVPGLVDPHLHLLALAARGAHLDCGGHDGVASLLRAVASVARRSPPGAWVRGEGLDEVALGRLPSAAELDRAAPRNPVRLRHRSRHASVVSGVGLARLGGGRVMPATALIVGREEAISRAVGPLPRAVLDAGLAEVARQLAAVGVTTVADATPRRWRALGPVREAVTAGRFPLRVFAMRPVTGGRWRAVGRLAPGPVKIMVHEEGAGTRPSALALARAVALASAGGGQVAVHCLGVATLAAALGAFAALPARWRFGRRHRLEHVAECPPSLVAQIASLGLTVVTNPVFVRTRGDVYRASVDGPPLAWLYRARTLAVAGVPLAAASDAPIAPPNPWLGIATARDRSTASGAILGPGETLGAAAAFALATTGAASALRADALGRLAVGGPADLVVVADDPLRAAPGTIAAMRPLLTMVGGEIVWRA